MRVLLFFTFIMLPSTLAAQLRGNNLFEYQLGNVPHSDDPDLSTHYNQLNLIYTWQKLTASARYEQFLHPDFEKEYYRLSQYSLSYRDKSMEIKIGNFNETLGNGILLRSYEIPGSVFEDQAYRVRQGFYRDLQGVKAGYNHRLFQLKLVRARSLLNLLPPGADDRDRRPDLVEAGELSTRILNQKAGFIFLRNTNSGISTSYLSFYGKGNIFTGLSYSFEISSSTGKNSAPWFSGTSASAVYTSLNYSAGNFGISLEYKDYRNMFLGAGISDPPTLVREQVYKVLNRSIHVPELSDESGYQAEIYYSFPAGHFLTLNHSMAKNELWKVFSFSEYFAEYQHFFENGNSLKIFADYSSDPIRLEFNRYSTGFSIELLHSGDYGSGFQFEYQQFKREDFLDAEITNLVGIISLHKGSDISLSLEYEMSTDPLQTDDPSSFEIERGNRHWLGLNTSWKLNPSNTLSLFAGKRRGGPACTSGICYEVLDFEGIELRLKTRF